MPFEHLPEDTRTVSVEGAGRFKNPAGTEISGKNKRFLSHPIFLFVLLFNFYKL